MYSSVANSGFKGHLCWIKWTLKCRLVILQLKTLKISAVCQSTAVTLYKVGRILSKGQ